MCLKKQERMREIKRIMSRHKEDIRLCLTCGLKPHLGYNSGQYDPETSPNLGYNYQPGSPFEAFTLYCPHCGYSAGTFSELPAALMAWHWQNEPNNPAIALFWAQKSDQQRAAHQAAKL